MNSITNTIISNNYSSFSLMFIKCDVEGYELDVLKGLNESIKKDFPLIQIEHDGKNSKSLEVINFLQSLGYKYLYARETKVPSPIQSILGSVGFWPKLIMINKVKQCKSLITFDPWSLKMEEIKKEENEEV